MTTTQLHARTTIYNGIEMRSRNEARFAAALDELGLAWKYEPAAFASGRMQYLPDFEVETSDGPLFLEVKPTKPQNLDEIIRRMRVIRHSFPDASLGVACPAWDGFVVVDRPSGITMIGHWAHWMSRGVEHHGVLGLGMPETAGWLLEFADNRFVGRHATFGDDWIDFASFVWRYDG